MIILRNVCFILLAGVTGIVFVDCSFASSSCQGFFLRRNFISDGHTLKGEEVVITGRAEGAKKVIVNIHQIPTDKIARVIEVTPSPDGAFRATWNGLDDGGQRLPFLFAKFKFSYIFAEQPVLSLRQ